ncbi:MAG: SpoVR family protein [Acidobacteriota bacterium]
MYQHDPTILGRLGFIPFPEELVRVKREFMAYARGQGLDPGEVIFDILQPDLISEVASYDGFPARYPHWRFGMAYDQMAKSYSWGLSKIYELVINNSPAFAYLLEGSSPVVQRMVIAHVIGHCDFFRRNSWFAGTNRNMLNDIANHAAKVKRYANRVGFERVESFLDTCLSVENLTDPNLLFHRPHPDSREAEREENGEKPQPRFTSPYLREYYRQVQPGAPVRKKETDEAGIEPFPQKPLKGVIDFLVRNAPLKDWERDILDIVREEAYYFLPQRLTKIMNEGWAVFWHTRIMQARGLAPGDVVEYADENAKVVAAHKGRLNPYRLGYFLFEDIRERWEKGRHGPDWETCTNRAERDNWDTKEGRGMEKILEVASAYNDAQFVDAFLTPDFAVKNRMYMFRFHAKENAFIIESREFERVKQALLAHLTNGGEPIIELADANYKNRSELFLKHRHAGVDLKLDEAQRTLHALYGLWRRPVNLETQVGGQLKRLGFNGTEDFEE